MIKVETKIELSFITGLQQVKKLAKHRMHFLKTHYCTFCMSFPMFPPLTPKIWLLILPSSGYTSPYKLIKG